MPELYTEEKHGYHKDPIMKEIHLKIHIAKRPSHSYERPFIRERKHDLILRNILTLIMKLIDG